MRIYEYIFTIVASQVQIYNQTKSENAVVTNANNSSSKCAHFQFVGLCQGLVMHKNKEYYHRKTRSLQQQSNFSCMMLVYDQNFYGGGGSSEGCLKWGSLRDLSKNILKQGVGKGKRCW